MRGEELRRMGGAGVLKGSGAGSEVPGHGRRAPGGRSHRGGGRTGRPSRRKKIWAAGSGGDEMKKSRGFIIPNLSTDRPLVRLSTVLLLRYYLGKKQYDPNAKVLFLSACFYR